MDWSLSLASFLFFLILYKLFQQRNSKFPINWPLIGMLPTLIVNNHRLLDFITSILRTSDHYTYFFKGPWLSGMDFLFTCDPANSNYMFNTHFSDYPKGEDYLQIFDALGDGLLSNDGETWVVQRKMAHAMFSDPRFRSSVAKCSRDKVAQALLPLLNHMVENDKAFDVNEVFMRFTFDTLCTLGYGIDPGCLSSDFPRMPFSDAVDVMLGIFFMRHKLPMGCWKLMRRFRLGTERNMAKSLVVMNNFIAQIIQKKRENRHKLIKEEEEEEPFNLLTYYMNSQSIQYDGKFLRDTLLAFLVAGKNGTGAALVWFFWLLVTHPEVERKILSELRQLHTQHSSIGKNENELEVFDAEEIEDLVYFHAALCETQRLYPTLPFNHKVAVKADVLPSGHRVQPGTKILFSMFSMGRMEGIWGKDCLEFKPERWITENGKLRHEPSYKFIAFHTGPRMCLGKNMTFIQMKEVAAAIIYNFKVEVAQKHILIPKPSIVLQTDGFMVKMKKRGINEY